MAFHSGISNRASSPFLTPGHQLALTLPEGNSPMQFAVSCPRFRSHGGMPAVSWRVVAVHVDRQVCNYANNSVVVGQTRALHPQNENHRFLETSDRLGTHQTAGSCNLPALASSAGQGSAAVLDQASSSSNKSLLPSKEDVAYLRGFSKKATTGAGGENSSVVTNAPKPWTKPLKVAVDVDEVLGSFLSSLNVFVADRYFLDYELSQYFVYDFMKIWGCSQAEANDRVHAFFESEHFNNGILPICGAHQSLLRLAEFCHLVIVTSRQHVIKKPTLEWIDRHYSGIFKEVHFGNHFALQGKARPKSEICRSIQAEILIDDNPRYAVECAEHGIEVLLFDLDNSYPWSKTADGPIHPLITRVSNWQEVEQALFARFCP